MEEPANSNQRPHRRWLQRGESAVASTGLAIAIILLGAMASSAWWSLRTHRASLHSTQESRTQAVGTLLAQTAEFLLASDELSAVRMLVTEAARNNDLQQCRIALPDGAVIADAQTANITLHRLPEQWSGASTQIEAPTSESGALTMSFPLEVPGRGRARLEMTCSTGATGWSVWEAQTGLGVIGAAGLLALLLIYRRMRSRLWAMGAIRDALLSSGQVDRNRQSLAIKGDAAPEATAWNQLLDEVEGLRRQLVALQSQEARGARREGPGDLEGVCDAMWQGLVLVDDQLQIKYVNGAAAVLLRAKREEMSGREVSKFINQETLLDPIRNVVNGTLRRRVINEIKLDGENGEGVLRFSVRPVRRGDTAAAMIIIEDVTQQRMAEEARNTFVAQATHELRMPLTNIRLYTENALEEGENDVEVRSKCLNVINQESKRLERIVGDMLSVAEIDAGTLKLRTGDVRLETLFEELRADYQAQASEREITLTFKLPPKFPVVKGDRDKIVLALHNLIGNALKYTPAKGTVTVSVQADEKQMIVEVSDTGIGISEDESELIFEKFYRSKDRRLTNIAGSGLGLAVAREVIRLHQGDITVRSQLNQGSTFTLVVPSAREAA